MSNDDKKKLIKVIILKKKIAVLFLAFILGLSACGKEQTGKKDNADITEYSKNLFAMDTYMELKAYGKDSEEAVEKAAEYIEKLDDMLSTGDENSEISILNRQREETVSDECRELIEKALEISKDTQGAFNPAIYPVMQLWGFDTKDFRVPEKNEIDKVLSVIDTEQIIVKQNEISLKKEGMKIDLGGIAKGYTSGKVMEIFREYGIESGLVSLGGNVQALGTKTDGSDWKVAVQHPDDSEQYLGILEINNKAVITSGGYERYFVEDGKTYHHIIDPATGYPADSGLKSVTIVSEDGTLADGLSTSIFIMGKDKGIEYWKNSSKNFDMILCTTDDELYVTSGISDDFSSDYEVEKIEKE